MLEKGQLGSRSLGARACTSSIWLLTAGFLGAFLLYSSPAALQTVVAHGFLATDRLAKAAGSAAGKSNSSAVPAAAASAGSSWPLTTARRLGESSCKVHGHKPHKLSCSKPLSGDAGGGSLDFVMISPRKSGTQHLWEDLAGAHPFVSNQAPCKNIFGKLIPADANDAEVEAILHQYLPKRCETHLEIQGEDAPKYWTSATVPPLLARHIPTVKLIAILRDPVTLFLSQLMDSLNFLDSPRCSEELELFHAQATACREQGKMRRPGLCRAGFNDNGEEEQSLITLGMYMPILEYWGQFFSISGAERQVLVMLAEWLEGDASERALQKVARFLGIPGWTHEDLALRSRVRKQYGRDEDMDEYHLLAGLGPTQWWCNAHQIEKLREIYSHSNRAVRDLITATYTADGESMDDWPLPDWLHAYEKEAIVVPEGAPAVDAGSLSLAQPAASQSCKTHGKMPAMRCEPQLGKANGGPLHFLVIAPSKSGTTALFEDLAGGHPFISNQMPCKEMHIFDELIPLTATHQQALQIIQQVMPKPCSTHLEVLGEATPRYWAIPTVPPLLARHVPAAKLLVPLRDPVKRFMSHLQMHKDYLMVPKCSMELEEFLAEEAELCEELDKIIDPATGSCNSGVPGRGFVRIGVYMPILEYWGRFHRITGDSRNVLVFASEWLQNWAENDKSDQILQKIAHFLGLPGWTADDLAQRPTARQHVGTNHISSMLHKMQESSVQWWCSEEQIQQLSGIFSSSNAKVRELITSTFQQDGENMKDWPFPDWLNGYKEEFEYKP